MGYDMSVNGDVNVASAHLESCLNWQLSIDLFLVKKHLWD